MAALVWGTAHTEPSPGVALSNGNLNATVRGLFSALGTVSKNSGKNYFEILIVSVAGASAPVIGVATAAYNPHTILGGDGFGWGVYFPGLTMIHSNAETPFGTLHAVAGDHVSILLDSDAGTISAYVNGGLSGIYTNAALIGASLFPSVSDGSSGVDPVEYQIIAPPTVILPGVGVTPWNGPLGPGAANFFSAL